jgi:hypothetical protein
MNIRKCHVYCPIWVNILYAHNTVRHWRVSLKKVQKGLFVSCGRKFIYIHSWRCKEQPAAVGVQRHGLTADSVVLRHGAHR